ncbi:MAG TPA: PKD domain-containing protein, partial [Solirubrobacter sp.]|nr:PKD domain-containing protein [Solirubrobacter sp.]
AERTVPVRQTGEPTPVPTASPTPVPNQPPTARIALEGTVARQHDSVTFVATGSGDPDGTIVSHDWGLDGDGSFESSTGTTPRATRTYDAAGPVTVRLRVTDDAGATAVAELRVSILSPTCRSSISAGALRATARCFRRHLVAGGAEYRATGNVSINGITVAVASGKTLAIRVPNSGRVTIESPSATVTVNARGNIMTLATGRVAWELDASNRLAGLKASSRATLAGLRVTGMPAPPQLRADGSSDVRFYVAMPSQFGSPTSDQPIQITPGKAAASNNGKLEFTVRDAAIGPIGLKHLRVRYDGNARWEIATSIGLPDPIPFTVSGEAGIRNGAFEYAGAGIDFGTPGIGPFGPVYLQRVKFRIEIKPKQSKCVPKVGVETIDWAKMLAQVGASLPPGVPRYSSIDHGVPTFALCGEVGLTGGPQILGAAAMRLDAGLGLATYSDRPAVFRAWGRLRLVEIPLADAALELHTDGYVRARAGFRYAIPDIVSLQGYLSLELLKAKFNAEGYAKACLDFVDLCASAKGLGSSRGIAVCLRINVIFDTWSPGFGMRWGRVPTPYSAGLRRRSVPRADPPCEGIQRRRGVNRLAGGAAGRGDRGRGERRAAEDHGDRPERRARDHAG